jgi:hypothetical protein
MKQAIGYCLILLCGVWTATAQSNLPARPTQPTQLVTKIGACESRLGSVEVVVSGVVEQGKSTIQIQCRVNQVETACEVAPTNALALAQLIESVSTDLRNGKQSGGRYGNIEVSAFVLEKEKFVEVLFHHGDSVTGETDCRLWLDSYNALGLSRLIASAQAVADWLQPRLKALE